MSVRAGLRNLMRARPRNIRSVLLLAAVLLVGCYAIRLGYVLVYWKTHIWVLSYLRAADADPMCPDDKKHIVFLMVDHYEHGGPNDKIRGARQNREWCMKFRQISDKHRDDYGNRFRYTWFYPYDHHNDQIMADLSSMASEGYGEIEMHWHLTGGTGVTCENYGEHLATAVAWYQQFGALITAEPTPRTAFAYVAGSWDLDASRGPGGHSVTNQLTELNAHGCYADFTFSTIHTPCQPAKVNSIYYAVDDPTQAKSYNRGVDVEVGKPPGDHLMIFEGPIVLDWLGRLEYGAVESDPRFRPERIKDWISANIHVHGRPEWVFVKVYTHGAQSRGVVLAHDMEWMLTALKRECQRRGLKLHYMTAREAYNVVKAAEAGLTGNPEDYRDYLIPPYRNCTFNTTSLVPDDDRSE